MKCLNLGGPKQTRAGVDSRTQGGGSHFPATVQEEVISMSLSAYPSEVTGDYFYLRERYTWSQTWESVTCNRGRILLDKKPDPDHHSAILFGRELFGQFLNFPRSQFALIKGGKQSSLLREAVVRTVKTPSRRSTPRKRLLF